MFLKVEFGICQGVIKKLECPVGQFISIKDFFFGRMDSTTCTHGLTINKKCQSPGNILQEVTYSTQLRQ